MGYEIFDDIICITLEGNTERQKLTTNTLSSLNIPFRFYVAKRNPRGGRIGCFESHINVIQECYNNNYQRVLIFEDDIVPTPSYSNRLINNATDFMKTNTNWEIFQLGYSCDVFKNTQLSILAFLTAKEVRPNIYNTYGLTTHAYCLSRNGMGKIINTGRLMLTQNDKEIPQIDRFYCDTLSHDKWHCLAPMIFDQRWCLGTDNIPFDIQETILRKFTCLAESLKVLYVISVLLHYRLYILIIILTTILFIFIFMNELKNV